MDGVLVKNLMILVTLFSYSISSARSAEQRDWYMCKGVLEPCVRRRVEFGICRIRVEDFRR